MKLNDLPTPALVVDLDRLENNISSMATRAQDLGVRLRPHVKTHKCLEIGRMQLAAGAAGITVSTIEEARAFADGGFDDITWAFPVIPSRIQDAAWLAGRVQFGVVIDSHEALEALAESGFAFKVWIKVDCGYHRAGVQPDGAALVNLAQEIPAAGLQFAGLMSHSGNAYDHATVAGRAAVAEEERATIVAAAGRLRTLGIEVPDVSVGSTPAMTAVESLDGATEARPGNYAFFDRDQLELGACELGDCALSVVSTVVSNAAGKGVCDAGALVMSKDPGMSGATMGEIWADYEGNELEAELRIAGLSQEHGKLTTTCPVGTRLRILPNHACLTAACFGSLYAVRGDEVEATWQVWNERS